MQKAEFNLLELHALISAYEISVRAKELAVCGKEKRLDELHGRCEALNIEIARNLEQLLSEINRD